MATTTNYGWTTPDDTALVKDGAAAIRSLGTAIDTTTYNNAQAAIAKAIVDAKGDIIAATAADTVSRLAVGANDTVLTADSSTATGLKWAAPASGSTFAGCRLYLSANQSVATNTSTLILFDSENFDSNGYHSTTTNTGRITIPSGKGGYYLFSLNISFGANSTGFRRLRLYKNGTEVATRYAPGLANSQNVLTLISIESGAENDYFEMYWLQTSGDALDAESGTIQTNFSTTYLGA